MQGILDERTDMEGLSQPMPVRGFEVAEYRERHGRAQQSMAAHGIDLLLLTTEADFRYFSGFHTPFWQSPTRPWYLLIPQAGAPVAIIPSIGEVCMRRTWVSDIRTWPSPRPEDDGIGLLVDAIQECCPDGARLGVPMGAGTHVRMPLAHVDQLRRAMPEVHWQDATELMSGLRSIKSAAEIQKLRYVCTMASRAFQSLPQYLREGMTDLDVFHAFRCCGLEAGVDEVRYLVGGVGPGGYDDIISPPSGRRLQRGDVLMLDTGCVFDGYFSDFDRNFAIGETERSASEAYDIAWQATEAGLDAARPGLTCSDLFDIMQAIMTPHAIGGKGEVGRLGHGLGMQLTEPPSLMSGDHTVLREGMVITLEPGYTFAPGKMMVHEENVVITRNGCELLNERAASTLPVVPW